MIFDSRGTHTRNNLTLHSLNKSWIRSVTACNAAIPDPRTKMKEQDLLSHRNLTVEPRHSAGPKHSTIKRIPSISLNADEAAISASEKLRTATLVLFFPSQSRIPATASSLPQKEIGSADCAEPVTATSVANMPPPAALLLASTAASKLKFVGHTQAGASKSRKPCPAS
jgi:hypothetical protein